MKNYRYLRIALAIITFLAFNLLFLDLSGWALSTWGWLAKWQLVPAYLALNLPILAAILLFTYLGGRHYCSWMCPLGIYQDIVARLRQRLSPHPYSPSSPNHHSRALILVIFTVLCTCGLLNIGMLLDPYGIYGRIASELFVPLVRLGNNWLADYAAAQDSYAIAPAVMAPYSATAFFIALGSWLVVTIMAWKNGRSYCNSICPVGTLLGWISTKSPCQVHLVEENCKSCKMCERVCKGACIDIQSKTIDNSRCLVCGKCWQTCKFEGIKYGKR